MLPRRLSARSISTKIQQKCNMQAACFKGPPFPFSTQLPPFRSFSSSSAMIAAARLMNDAPPLAKAVDVQFSDGAKYRFLALWLRDACPDEKFWKQSAGERILSNAMMVAHDFEKADYDVKVVENEVDANGCLRVTWCDGSSGVFEPDFLRAYADQVAQPLSPIEKTERTVEDHAGNKVKDQEEDLDLSWLLPYSGIPAQPAPKPSDLNLFSSQTGFQPKHFRMQSLLAEDEDSSEALATNLQLIKHLLLDGVVKVTDIENPGEAALHAFADRCFGGLQKDPSRAEANWKIESKESAGSISYAPHLRLNNHTDQSLPNHGIPAIALVMHYANGHGVNTMVDAFAVAEKLRATDYEAFELLSKFGSNQERDLLASRSDAKQNHTQSLWLSSGRPILQLDGSSSGNVVRVQYNEVFRVASTVPYEVFPKWYKAYLKFAKLCHDAEFELHLPMKAGEIAVFMNWRVMHGRAGNRDGSAGNLQSPDRVLVGGTVTRENLFSRARELVQKVEGVKLYGPQLAVGR